jgi:hypothetical protein
MQELFPSDAVTWILLKDWQNRALAIQAKYRAKLRTTLEGVKVVKSPTTRPAIVPLCRHRPSEGAHNLNEDEFRWHRMCVVMSGELSQYLACLRNSIDG